jgi:hypothetical protein
VPGRLSTAALVSLALATAIHLDWHVARPAQHHLSLGLPWHWALAIPVFALVGWYIARAWAAHVVRAFLGIVGSAVVLAGVVEPAWEYSLGGATFEWAFGATRTAALVAFVGTGVVASTVGIALLRHSRASQIAG